jgi:hypothetical protein
MFSQEGERRARPSLKSILLSVLVFSAVIYLAATRFFLYDVYMPVGVSLVISLVVFAYRSRNLRQKMPEPYGKGKTSTVDAKAAMRSGILLSVGGGLFLVGLMGSVFFLPSEVFFAILLGVIGGLPLSDIFFFALTTQYERKSGCRVLYVTNETTIEGETALVKSVALSED